MLFRSSALKGETVPDSLPATPKSPPTRRVPPRGPPFQPSLGLKTSSPTPHTPTTPLPHWAALLRGWYRGTESSYLFLSVCPQGSRSPQAQLSVLGPSPRYGPADLTPKAWVDSPPSHHLQPSLSTQGRHSAARVWGQPARQSQNFLFEHKKQAWPYSVWFSQSLLSVYIREICIIPPP